MAKKSIKRNAIYSVLGEFVTLVFPLITFPYASRILLPEGIGIVNFANSIISYFLIIASLGISIYGIRELAKLKDDKYAQTKFVKEMILINFVCSIIAYFLFLISLYLIPKFSECRNLLLICSLKIIVVTFSADWIFSAMEDFKYITIRALIFRIISIFYLFIFVKTPEDIGHYTFFGIFNTIGATFTNLIRINKYIDLRIKTKIEIKKHLKPIFVFFAMTLVTSIYSVLDSSMLGFLSTNTELGYYSASTKLNHMVLSMLTAITTVLLPRLSMYIKENDMDSFNEISKKCSCVITILGIPIATGIFLLAKPFMLLLSGKAYIPAVPVMQLMTPIILIISIGSLVGVQILPALGKEKISLYSYIAGAVTNITLNAILIPKYGAIGAGIGTVFAELTVTLIEIIYVRKIIITKDLIISFFESIISSAIMIIPILFILNRFENILIQIGLSFIAGVILYFVFMLIFRNKYVLEYTKKFLHKEI